MSLKKKCSCPSKFNDGGDPTVMVKEFSPTYLLGQWREDPDCPVHGTGEDAASDRTIDT